MNEQSVNRFLTQLNELESLSNASDCFSILTQGVNELAGQLQQRQQSTPFVAWWHACCELLSPRQIRITTIGHIESAGQKGADEFVEITNHGPMIIDLSQWRLNAKNQGRNIIFPKGTHVFPDTSIVIYTRKKGENSFNSPVSIWNDQGEQADLYDSSGNLVCTYVYHSMVSENE